MSAQSDFINRANLNAMEVHYQQWLADPSSVGPEWQNFFAGFQLGMEEPLAPARDPAASATNALVGPTPIGQTSQQNVDSLIYAYRDIGHTICRLDPLDLNNREHNPALELDRFNMSAADLDKVFATGSIPGLPKKAKLRDIIGFLRETYCGEIGAEYLHIQDHERRYWIRNRIEPTRNKPQLEREQKRRILMKLSQADLLEAFIHAKFLGQKRFSLEGGECLIPALDSLVEMAPDHGVKEIVFGTAHRGRLNVLVNVLNKSYEELFTEFEGVVGNAWGGDGDVKYHLGFSSDHVTSRGHKIHLSLTANPSHLEAVNAVVLGRVRGKQRQHGDTKTRSRVLPVLIHGDAALAGQGSVMEILKLTQLEGYGTGGTVHVVLNNQIGFTTLPSDARSTPYCTDICKMIEAPIFHVNGDNPEAVVHAMHVALDFRQTFHRDAVVDIVCYRRHGHNETDEPSFTQPTLYAKIKKKKATRQRYVEQVLQNGDLNQDEVDNINTIMKNQLQGALDSIKVTPAKSSRTTHQGVWAGLSNRYDHSPVATGVPLETLDAIGKALSTWPQDFHIHPKIKRLAEERGRTISSRAPIDWALAEQLAIGSLLCGGIPVRLSGQDSRRGTFSQRHSYWYDVQTRQRYKPLNHIKTTQPTFCVYNSPLSEFAVMAFDYGYSLSEPGMLIMWEAQFGDFANGAQVVIDQFITSSESKWGRESGIVLMLPHGQEGMGPEHSSARLERFLQACAQDNIQVAYCSTAAQHFHILRRQMHRHFRKPLILMTPKSHLRSKEASSDIRELVDGRFHEVLTERNDAVDLATVRRVVFATGKVLHELRHTRDELDNTSVAIIGIEQLYPTPREQLRAAMQTVNPEAELVWCQEEPKNMGAWFFMQPRLLEWFDKPVRYVGRDAAASPAPGSASAFRNGQQQLLHDALQA